MGMLTLLEKVDTENVDYHCEVTIMIPHTRVQQPMKVGAVLDSGSAVYVYVGACSDVGRSL